MIMIEIYTSKGKRTTHFRFHPMVVTRLLGMRSWYSHIFTVSTCPGSSSQKYYSKSVREVTINDFDISMILHIAFSHIRVICFSKVTALLLHVLLWVIQSRPQRVHGLQVGNA